jgi:2-polyprenyl-3-methyl-5-hydroxy-6-metoxy-1,4-benzoquinol methylase
MLEVGSGYGFTRAAAAALGSEASGIDLNPAAAEAASRLYGMHTFVGTLASVLDAGAIGRGEWDTVLYDFVLEHLADPQAELQRAAELLKPAGVLALTLPSMTAAEVEVFGGAYRSFRSDHRHIFSRRSLERMLDRAGLRLVALDSGCTVHLLRGILSDTDLSHLYKSGRGPDLTVVAALSRP